VLFSLLFLFSLCAKFGERKAQVAHTVHHQIFSKRSRPRVFFPLFFDGNKKDTILSSSSFASVVSRACSSLSLEHALALASSSLSRKPHYYFKMAPVVAIAQRSAAVARPAVSTRAAAPSAVAAAAGSPTQSIRIKLKSFDTRAIVEAGEAIIGAAASTGATVSGPVPLPTR
jgi:hypothetical protein